MLIVSSTLAVAGPKMVPMSARLMERRPTAPMRASPCSNHSIRLGIWYRYTSQAELAKYSVVAHDSTAVDRNVRQLAKKSTVYFMIFHALRAYMLSCLAPLLDLGVSKGDTASDSDMDSDSVA